MDDGQESRIAARHDDLEPQRMHGALRRAGAYEYPPITIDGGDVSFDQYGVPVPERGGGSLEEELGKISREFFAAVVDICERAKAKVQPKKGGEAHAPEDTEHPVHVAPAPVSGQDDAGAEPQDTYGIASDDDGDAYTTISSDMKRTARLYPTEMQVSESDIARLPSILSLGAGDETSLATKLMRAAAGEIGRLRAENERLRKELSETYASVRRQADAARVIIDGRNRLLRRFAEVEKGLGRNRLRRRFAEVEKGLQEIERRFDNCLRHLRARDSYGAEYLLKELKERARRLLEETNDD